MNQDLERFRTAVRDSAELREKVASARNPEELVTFARSKGYSFSSADLDEWSKRMSAGRLTDDELELIAGGVGSQTAGGGNTSIWGKIKSIMFGVDPSFYD